MEDLRVIRLIDYSKIVQCHDLGVVDFQPFNHFGYTRLPKNGPILLPSVGPFFNTDSEIFTQSGVISLWMDIAQKVIG